MSDIIIGGSSNDVNIGKDRKMITNKNITVDHFKAAVVLRTFIQKCPMDQWCKKVMLLRVGRPWEGIMPKTHLQIALELRCTEKEVIEIETAGKGFVADFMQRCSDMAMSKDFEKNLASQAIKQENTTSTIITPDEPSKEAV